MRPFACVCGNTLFFDNTRCNGCRRGVGWCPRCAAVVAVEPAGEGAACTACHSGLIPCHNRAVEDVCNRFLAAPASTTPQPLCDACRHNRTIPDLSVEDNRAKWARLEAAKRRLFYELDGLGLPRGDGRNGPRPPLSFDFMADVVPGEGSWRTMEAERIYTGHAGGRITINIREADDAERERIRLDMGESYRTLVGHFRHEIGHYYWEVLIGPDAGRRAAFALAFGDPDRPSYADALRRHHGEGPPADWADRYVTAYATMHPWEDWAETFAAYLEMVATLDTAAAWGLASAAPAPGAGFTPAEFDAMIHAHQRLGVALNEVNRSMGLPDLLTRNLVPPVVEKLRFVHGLVASAARRA